MGTDVERRPPAVTLPGRASLVAAALVLLALPFGVPLVLVVTGWGPLERLDLQVSSLLHDPVSASPGLADVLTALTHAFDPWTLRVLVLVVAVLALRGPRRPTGVWLVMTVWTSGMLTLVVKPLVGRDRPVFPDPVAEADGLSFPSGHALGATVACGAIVLAAWPVLQRRGRAVAVALAVTIAAVTAFTRVALGVHYLSDVVGGIALGLAWLALAATLYPGRATRPTPDDRRAQRG